MEFPQKPSGLVLFWTCFLSLLHVRSPLEDPSALKTEDSQSHGFGWPAGTFSLILTWLFISCWAEKSHSKALSERPISSCLGTQARFAIVHITADERVRLCGVPTAVREQRGAEKWRCLGVQTPCDVALPGIAQPSLCVILGQSLLARQSL